MASPPRAPTFKTTPKSVVLFKETDTIPSDATKDLQEAYKAALQLIRGEIQLKHMTTPTTNRGSKRSQSSSPSTSNNSMDEPVPAKKARRNTESHGESEFSRFTVVLVDKTDAKKWPALLTDVSDRNLAVRHFPLAENPKSTSYPYSRAHNVTYDDIGDLIGLHDRKAPEYVRALVAAEEFIEHPSNYIQLPPGFVMTQKVPEGRIARKAKPLPATSSPVSRPKAKAVFKTTRATAAAAAAAAAAATASSQPVASSSTDSMTRVGSVKTTSTSPTKPVTASNDLPKDSANHSNGLNIGGLSLVNSLLKVMVSLDAQEYMKKIWAGKIICKRNASYKRVTNVADAHISLNIGDLLEFNELEVFIAEMQDWIKLSPKLPKMTSFDELHYISNVVLPELLVYALQQVRKISKTEAEQVLADAVNNKPTTTPKPAATPVKSPPKPEPADVDVTNYDDLPEEGNSSFDCLLRAVSIEREAKKV
uniref:Bromo domain-containing protein n=1 Tax=Panagrellus redivivus TaxID=6233 RepID=A0A7E4VGG8_PANRE